MVVDTLEKLEFYVGLNPLFADVVEFIKNNDLNKLEEGKHFIKDKDLLEAKMETHRRMIDIQIPLDAPEVYGYTPLCDLPELEYNDEKDVTKYDIIAQTYVKCNPGQFAIFFPQDGHTPCIGETPEIRKAIFKVKA